MDVAFSSAPRSAFEAVLNFQFFFARFGLAFTSTIAIVVADDMTANAAALSSADKIANAAAL